MGYSVKPLALEITVGASGVTWNYVTLENPEHAAPEHVWDTRTGRLEDWSWGDPTPEYPEVEIEPSKPSVPKNWLERVTGLQQASNDQKAKKSSNFLERLKGLSGGKK